MTSIMLVDDDEETLDAMREVLLAEGYTIQCARDGEQATRLLDHGRPDLVILDLMMPRVNGWRFLARIGELPDRFRPRVLLFTADSRSEMDTSTGGGAVIGRLGKPIDLDELLAQVATATAHTSRREADR